MLDTDTWKAQDVRKVALRKLIVELVYEVVVLQVRVHSPQPDLAQRVLFEPIKLVFYYLFDVANLALPRHHQVLGRANLFIANNYGKHNQRQERTTVEEASWVLGNGKPLDFFALVLLVQEFPNRRRRKNEVSVWQNVFPQRLHPAHSNTLFSLEEQLAILNLAGRRTLDQNLVQTEVSLAQAVLYHTFDDVVVGDVLLPAVKPPAVNQVEAVVKFVPVCLVKNAEELSHLEGLADLEFHFFLQVVWVRVLACTSLAFIGMAFRLVSQLKSFPANGANVIFLLARHAWRFSCLLSIPEAFKRITPVGPRVTLRST